jgi:pyrroloquinoline quinone biosynthesis protein B
VQFNVPSVSHAAVQVVQGVDHAFLDACFYDATELPGRDIKEIPHPLIVDTIARLSGPLAHKVVLIHMNHSNPVYRDGPERAACLDAGFQVGRQGEIYDI